MQNVSGNSYMYIRVFLPLSLSVLISLPLSTSFISSSAVVMVVSLSLSPGGSPVTNIVSLVIMIVISEWLSWRSDMRAITLSGGNLGGAKNSNNNNNARTSTIP